MARSLGCAVRDNRDSGMLRIADAAAVDINRRTN
jgi:hypothetical protein